MASQLGQYCISVTDLDRSVRFYCDVLGLKELERISVPEADEVILGSHDGQGRHIQLAQRKDLSGPIDHGNALWKLYLYCDDIDSLHEAALASGSESLMPPTALAKWPVIVAFITDPDGYRIEVLQRTTTD